MKPFYTGWWRREDTINRDFDPTARTVWRCRLGKLEVELEGIWEVEGKVSWRGRTIYRGYAVRWAEWVFNRLEEKWWGQQPENQPDYDWELAAEIEAAERSAGWDPNP
jgi:hypothetical protein